MNLEEQKSNKQDQKAKKNRIRAIKQCKQNNAKNHGRKKQE